MKIKNYEQTGKLYVGILLLIIMEMIGIIFLYHQKQFSYHVLTGIVIKKDYLVVMINQEERKSLYRNKTLFVKGKKKKYKIIEDHGKLLRKDKKDYYEIIIGLSFSKNYKPNDMIKLSIANKKYRQIEIFKIIWGGA